jgi:hypothetical protein
MKTAPLIIALSACACLSPAIAQQVTDFNFDNVTIGDPVPTTYPSVDSIPQHVVYATGGFPDTPPYTATNTVENVGTLSHAAEMMTTQGGTGANYIDTQFLVSAPIFDLSFDLYIGSIPNSVLPQGGVGAPNGQAFALNVFDLNSNRVMRFAVSPTSDTTGNLGFRQPGAAGDLTTFGTYTEGQTYHLEFVMNYGTGTANVFLDNAQVLTNAPLTAPGNGMEELFFFQNGVEGELNNIAIDNIELTAVPEPGTWGAGALAALALAFFGIRRREAATAKSQAVRAKG